MTDSSLTPSTQTRPAAAEAAGTLFRYAAMASNMEVDRPSDGPPEGTSLSFGDLLDVVNPLQHIPIVSSIYRALTGDQIAPAARLAGGAVFGGPVGLIASFANAIVEAESGADAGAHVLAAFAGAPPAELVAAKPESPAPPPAPLSPPPAAAAPPAAIAEGRAGALLLPPGAVAGGPLPGPRLGPADGEARSLRQARHAIPLAAETPRLKPTEIHVDGGAPGRRFGAPPATLATVDPRLLQPEASAGKRDEDEAPAPAAAPRTAVEAAPADGGAGPVLTPDLMLQNLRKYEELVRGRAADPA